MRQNPAKREYNNDRERPQHVQTAAVSEKNNRKKDEMEKNGEREGVGTTTNVTIQCELLFHFCRLCSRRRL
jgi:hypothetical protein